MRRLGILERFGLSPPEEKPPPPTRDVRQVGVDGEGRELIAP